MVEWNLENDFEHDLELSRSLQHYHPEVRKFPEDAPRTQKEHFIQLTDRRQTSGSLFDALEDLDADQCLDRCVGLNQARSALEGSV